MEGRADDNNFPAAIHEGGKLYSLLLFHTHTHTPQSSSQDTWLAKGKRGTKPNPTHRPMHFPEVDIAHGEWGDGAGVSLGLAPCRKWKCQASSQYKALDSGPATLAL